MGGKRCRVKKKKTQSWLLGSQAHLRKVPGRPQDHSRLRECVSAEMLSAQQNQFLQECARGSAFRKSALAELAELAEIAELGKFFSAHFYFRAELAELAEFAQF